MIDGRPYNPHTPDWHKVAPDDIDLATYAAAWIDMAPHVEQLREYARGKRSIVEFGLRGGVSTWALLEGMHPHGYYVGVDIDPNTPIPARVRTDPRFELRIGDTATVPLPASADLVMIDASHEFAPTVLELIRAAAMGPEVILCHDYLYPETPGVARAIDGYTAPGYLRDEPYRLEMVHPSRWGLAVLVRR